MPTGHQQLEKRSLCAPLPQADSVLGLAALSPGSTSTEFGSIPRWGSPQKQGCHMWSWADSTILKQKLEGRCK